MLQADSGLQQSGNDGVADGVGVVVRQLGYPTGRLHQGGFVVKVGQCDRRCAHERTVARRATTALVERF